MSAHTKRQYINMLRGRAKRRGDKCHLTLEQLDQLLDDAGITMDDVGQQSQQYCLGRYGDTGNYEMGNCRFITIRENVQEALKGKTRPDEIGKKISKSRKGFRMSEEQKKAISETKTGSTWSQQRRETYNNMTPEQKAQWLKNKSDAVKGSKWSKKRREAFERSKQKVNNSLENNNK